MGIKPPDAPKSFVPDTPGLRFFERYEQGVNISHRERGIRFCSRSKILFHADVQR
jgi:hypothetical protein